MPDPGGMLDPGGVVVDEDRLRLTAESLRFRPSTAAILPVQGLKNEYDHGTRKSAYPGGA
jgi:hypothetical protein